MKRGTIVVLAAIACIAGCGGGDSSVATARTGSLSLRALWQNGQTGGSGQGLPLPPAGFGPEIPPAAQTIQFVFRSAELSCCTKISRAAAESPPILDPDTGRRHLVLVDLPVGGANAQIRAFPSAVAPRPEDVFETCATDPAGVSEPCDTPQFATESFDSDPVAVEIVGAMRSPASTILINASPFLVPGTLDPAPGVQALIPIAASFVVADAFTPIDPESVAVTFEPAGAPVPGGAAMLVACDDLDSEAEACSEGRMLEVVGLRVTDEPTSLPAGPTTIRIQARTHDAEPRLLDADYAFVAVGEGGSTATPTPTATPVEPATPTPTGSPGPAGAVRGTVVDCLEGSAIAGASVELVRDGEPSIVMTSDESGRFAFAAVPFGPFLLRVTRQGFIAAESSGTLDAEQPEPDLTIAICPVAAENQLRVVLNWGQEPPAPADLDAHLRGPTGGEPAEFHVYFGSDFASFPNGGSAQLDIDDVSFGGPETITVTELPAGVFRYCVHDFSNRSETAPTGIANSSARVSVFLGAEQIGEFLAPSGGGSVWEVFQVDTRENPPAIAAVNALTDESDPDAVCAQSVGIP